MLVPCLHFARETEAVGEDCRSINVLRGIPIPAAWAKHEPAFAKIGEAMASNKAELSLLVDRAEQLARGAFDISERTSTAIERIMAGFEAADGRVRFPEPEQSVNLVEHDQFSFNQAPGSVTKVSPGSVQVWIHGGPDDGFTLDTPHEMPGWLQTEGSTFELTGTPYSGRYRFQRASHLPDDLVMGS